MAYQFKRPVFYIDVLLLKWLRKIFILFRKIKNPDSCRGLSSLFDLYFRLGVCQFFYVFFNFNFQFIS